MANIALVLSGGTAKGAYQIGALKALLEYLKPSDIPYVSAASSGSLNAYAFCTDTLETAKDWWLNINKDLDRVSIVNLYKSKYLDGLLEFFTEKELICQKLYIPILQLNPFSLNYFNFSEIPMDKRYENLKAAITLPPFTAPIKVDGRLCCDGAMIDNIPIHPILKEKLDYVICIYFDSYNYTFESEYFDNKIIKIAFDKEEKLLASNFMFTRDRTERMIAEGYEKAKAIFEIVFSNGVEDVDTIYKKIEVLNTLNPKKRARVTGDIVLNNTNKITKRLTRRKII